MVVSTLSKQLHRTNCNRLVQTQCLTWVAVRQELLRQAVRDAPTDGYRIGPAKTVRAKILLCLPGTPLFGDGTVASVVGNSLDTIRDMFDRAIRLQACMHMS